MTQTPWSILLQASDPSVATLADIHPAATRTLRGVVQNTWLDNREDQLSEPLAAIIQCDLKARTATVTYHLGDDSEAWRFNDDNFRELLAALAR